MYFSNPERFPLRDDNFCEDKHSELIDKALNTIKQNNMYLEINPHFAVSQNDIAYMYPSASIAEVAINKEIKFSYGSDAHICHDVGAMLEVLRSHKVYSRVLKSREEQCGKTINALHKI